MPAYRHPAAAVTIVTTLGIAALTLSATPASAHGSMGDPVSKVAQCYAEGPEAPRRRRAGRRWRQAAHRRCTTGTASVSVTRAGGTGR